MDAPDPQSSHDIELETKLTEAFDLFDHEKNKTIDFRELGTVIRAAGGVPTEAQILHLVKELENDPPNGYINFEKFLPVVLDAMESGQFKGASENELLRAFQLFDPEKKGFINAATLEALVSQEGEPFTPDELEEMLAAATDITRGKIVYREYAVQLTSYDEPW